MSEDRKKLFIKRSSGGNILIICILLIVAAIFAAVLLLIQGKTAKEVITSGGGFGRNSMFPFVYTSEDDHMYVIKDETLSASEIDDTVTDCLHDCDQNCVYYLRDNNLYEYDISKDTRRIIISGVSSYSLSGKRSFIIFESVDGSLKMFDGNKSVTLSEQASFLGYSLYSVGSEHCLFVTDVSEDGFEGNLSIVDVNGKIKSLNIKADIRKTFSLCSDDSRIIAYSGDTMLISNIAGKIILSDTDSEPVSDTELPVLFSGSDTVVQSDGNMEFKYYLKSIEDKDTKELYKISGNKAVLADSDVDSIIFYDSETELIIYTKKTNGILCVYKNSGSGNEKQLSCPDDTEFIFDEDKNYLYYRLPDGRLFRYNIYDVTMSVVFVSDNAGKLYVYNNKYIVAFMTPDEDVVSLILNNNSIVSYSLKEENRFYGAGDTYLLLRVHGSNDLSLDLVNDGEYKRVASDVRMDVYFDKDFEYILYVSGDTLCCYKDKTSVSVGDFGKIKAVRMTSDN